jgi:hypothetical protein
MVEYGIDGGTMEDPWGRRLPQYLENCIDDCQLTLDNSTVTGAADVELVQPYSTLTLTLTLTNLPTLTLIPNP